jgi:hypothetical protein
MIFPSSPFRFDLGLRLAQLHGLCQQNEIRLQIAAAKPQSSVNGALGQPSPEIRNALLIEGCEIVASLRRSGR